MIWIYSFINKCSEMSMEVKLPVFLETYDWPTDQPNDGETGS